MNLARFEPAPPGNRPGTLTTKSYVLARFNSVDPPKTVSKYR